MEYGRLETEPTAVVCRRLGEESRTGCLRLREDGAPPAGDIRIYLHEGRIYTATAPAGRPRLGDRLVGGGHLSPTDLENALDAQARLGGGVRLGEILIRERRLSRDLLREIVRDQICDSLAVALSRQTGQWRFVDGESVEEDVPLGMGMQDTLLEGSRRLGELAVITSQLGSMDAIVDFVPGSAEVRVSLKADEWEMMTHIDGRTTIAEIADRTGYSQLETARIVYGLVSGGILQTLTGRGMRPVVSTPQPAPAQPAGPPRAEVDDLLGEISLLSSPPAPPPQSPPPGPSAVPPPPPPSSPPAGDDDTGGKGLLGRLRRK